MVLIVAEIKDKISRNKETKAEMVGHNLQNHAL